MKFLMLVYPDPSAAPTPEEAQKISPAVQEWITEMEGRGIRLIGDMLQPVDAGVTVSVRGGETVVDTGVRPQAETPLSGFNILECADMDEAIRVSAQHAMARFGVIELRPLANFGGGQAH